MEDELRPELVDGAGHRLSITDVGEAVIEPAGQTAELECAGGGLGCERVAGDLGPQFMQPCA